MADILAPVGAGLARDAFGPRCKEHRKQGPLLREVANV